MRYKDGKTEGSQRTIHLKLGGLLPVPVRPEISIQSLPSKSCLIPIQQGPM